MSNQINLQTIELKEKQKELESELLERKQAEQNLTINQEKLEKVNREIEIQNKQKTGLHYLSTKMHGEQNVEKLGKNILLFILDFFSIPLGAVFVLDSNHLLKRIASFGYPDNENLPTELKLESGLIGKAVSLRKPVTIDNVPEHVKTSFGFGTFSMNSVLAYPFFHNKHLICVLELGSFDSFNKEHFDWLKEAENSISLAMYSAIENSKHKEMEAQLLRYESTGRLKAEDKNRKLSMAIEQSPVSVFITDLNGKIEYINNKFTELYGYSFNEVMGRNPRILKSDDYSGEYYSDSWKKMNAGEIWQGEFKNTKKNGELCWVSSTISPIKTKDQSLTHFVAIEEDITDRKVKEIELKIAKQDAEKASHAKGEFLARMSHEIRTPMNGIIGMSQLALMTDLSPKQYDYLSKIELSAHSLLSIINDILDISKVEAGKMELQSSNFNLEEKIHNLFNLVKLKAEEKELEILFSLDDKVPLDLIGDPLRLGQVILNLVNNAIKFTENGEIVLYVNLVNIEENEAVLEFTVKDTGIGLTDDQIDKLFHPFSQTDHSASKQDGTGLGLVICKRFVEMLGGSIYVKSKPGKGSMFIFTAKFDIQNKENYNTVMQLPIDLKGKNVLVVDDNASSCQIIKRSLESFTLNPTIVNSGQEAIETLINNNSSPDSGPYYKLILVDLKMPNQSGIETVMEINRSRDIPEIPIIMMVSMNGLEKVKKEFKNLRISSFLVKPISRSLLFDTIMETFGTKTIDQSKRKSHKIIATNEIKNLKGSRILLVEDNKINQQIAAELLESVDLIVTVVNNGKEAIETLNKKEFDLVLMDVQMPVLGGCETTINIRKNPMFKDLPIVAITAQAMIEDRAKCLEAGMNDYITKPIDTKELFSALVKWIKPTNRSDRSLVKVNNRSKPDRKIRIDNKNLPYLPGIDTSAGLKRFNDDSEFYTDLLKMFKSDFFDSFNEIKKSLDNNDFVEAEMLVHNLKGVSGNIGAVALQKAAHEVETSIHQKKLDECGDLLEDFKFKFDEVHTSLQVL